MYYRSDIIYVYDGSFYGLLCCAAESMVKKEQPFRIVKENDMLPSIFECRRIETCEAIARKLLLSIERNISLHVKRFIYLAFLSQLEDRETMIVDFIYMAYSRGRQILEDRTAEPIHTLWKAVVNLQNESHLFKGFVRFTDYGGVMVSEIEPKNSVLPLIKDHFVSRYPRELLFIYDKTHHQALLAKCGKGRIIALGDEDIDFFAPEETELKFQELWRCFYGIVSIEERRNEACQNSHLPKRYRSAMTEFQDHRRIQPKARQELNR